MKKVNISLTLLTMLLVFMSCGNGTIDNDNNPGGSAFIAVTGITGVPTTGIVGTSLALTGTVAPANATNKNIVWTIVAAGTGAPGAAISGNTLTATGPGDVTVKATIANGTAPGTDFTREFVIIINPATFVAVTRITGVPTTGTVGTPLTLTGTVAPVNATNKGITWTIVAAGTDAPGVAISGNILTATGPGDVTVRATIANGTAPGTDYTRSFIIVIDPTAFVPVTGISGVPTTGTAGTPLTLTGTVTPANATNKTIVWTVASAGTTGTAISGNALTATGSGDVTVRATITNGTAPGTDYTRDFVIVIDPTAFVPVTGISGVPTAGIVGTPLALTGTVAPANATNKIITWTIVGTTILPGPAVDAMIVEGNTLLTSGSGDVTVRATIANGTAPGTDFTRNFVIVIDSTAFVAVTGITGVPTHSAPHIPLTLTGTVMPANATNKNIVWTIVGYTNPNPASIEGNTLINSNNGAGDITVRATIADGTAPGTDYTRDFVIVIIWPVSIITNVPTAGIVGTPLALTGTVSPSDATNKTITWTIIDAGTTGATISGNTLNTTTTGTVTVRATIANGTAPGTAFTQDFVIVINTAAFVAVTSITGVPTAGILGTPLTLTGSVAPANATNKTIAWTVANAGTTGATINGNILTTTGPGDVTVRATIANGTAPGTNYTQDFNITIHGESLPALPAAPTGVTATDFLTVTVGPYVHISWNTVPGATSYKVYISEQSGNWNDFEEATDTSVYGPVFYDRTYYFKVTAINSVGEGPASAIVSYTINQAP